MVPAKYLPEEGPHVGRDAREVRASHQVCRGRAREAVLQSACRRGEENEVSGPRGQVGKEQQGRPDQECDPGGRGVHFERYGVGIDEPGGERAREVGQDALAVEGELAKVAGCDAEGRVGPRPRHRGACLLDIVEMQHARQTHAIDNAAVEGQQTSQGRGSPRRKWEDVGFSRQFSVTGAQSETTVGAS